MDKIVTEFIQTERVYCNFLELTLEYFFKIVPISNGIKDPKDVQLFRELQTNWGQLYQFHTSFLLTLETRCLLGGGKVGSQMTESGSHSVVARSTGNSNSNSNSNNSLHPLVLKKNAAQGLANVVIKLSPYFKLYSGYCRLYPLILPILEAAQENSTEFEAAVKHFESLPRAKNLSLGSIIVKPIQRVCKYELFLRDLQKKIPPNNVDLMTDVVMAYTATQNVVGKVNETGKTGEQLAKLAELQEQLRPLGKVNVLKSHRRLDLQGNAMAVQMLPNGESNNDRSGSSNNSSNNSNSNSNSNSNHDNISTRQSPHNYSSSSSSSSSADTHDTEEALNHPLSTAFAEPVHIFLISDLLLVCRYKCKKKSLFRSADKVSGNSKPVPSQSRHLRISCFQCFFFARLFLLCLLCLLFFVIFSIVTTWPIKSN